MEKNLWEYSLVKGLASNFAALRALALDGISKGHMRLHANKIFIYA